MRPNATKLLAHDFLKDVAEQQVRMNSSSFSSPRAGDGPPRDGGMAIPTSLPLTDPLEESAQSVSTGDVLHSIEEAVENEPPTPVINSARRESTQSESMGEHGEAEINECDRISADAVEWARGKDIEIIHNLLSRGVRVRGAARFADSVFGSSF